MANSDVHNSLGGGGGGSLRSGALEECPSVIFLRFNAEISGGLMLAVVSPSSRTIWSILVGQGTAATASVGGAIVGRRK
jgi:hypothetical protein